MPMGIMPNKRLRVLFGFALQLSVRSADFGTPHTMCGFKRTNSQLLYSWLTSKMASPMEYSMLTPRDMGEQSVVVTNTHF